MATTIYNFQADLTQLLRLNRELEAANANLLRLKANTRGYAATAKSLGTMTTAMGKTGKSMKSANASAKALSLQVSPLHLPLHLELLLEV